MAAFLSQAWTAAASDPTAAAMAAAGRPIRVQHVLTGGPDGEVRLGSVVDAAGSVETVAGDVAEPDVTLTLAVADALTILRGDVSPNVAYMRGRLKAAGHTGRLLELLAEADGPVYDEVRAALWERTET